MGIVKRLIYSMFYRRWGAFGRIGMSRSPEVRLSLGEEHLPPNFSPPHKSFSI